MLICYLVFQVHFLSVMCDNHWSLKTMYKNDQLSSSR